MVILNKEKYRILKNQIPSLPLLLEKNEAYKKRFSKNLLFKWLEEDKINISHRDIFLSYFQVLSSNFQKMMLLKTALCDNSEFIPIFHQHYKEEYGHAEILKRESAFEPLRKDAILEALCNWFPSKILTFTPHEQIVLVHLCLEAAATVLFSIVSPYFDPHNELKYFKIHLMHDAEHEEMGIPLLEDLTENQYRRLLEVQEDAWNMFEALMSRIAELTVQTAPLIKII